MRHDLRLPHNGKWVLPRPPRPPRAPRVAFDGDAPCCQRRAVCSSSARKNWQHRTPPPTERTTGGKTAVNSASATATEGHRKRRANAASRTRHLKRHDHETAQLPNLSSRRAIVPRPSASRVAQGSGAYPSRPIERLDGTVDGFLLAESPHFLPLTGDPGGVRLQGRNGSQPSRRATGWNSPPSVVRLPDPQTANPRIPKRINCAASVVCSMPMWPRSTSLGNRWWVIVLGRRPHGQPAYSEARARSAGFADLARVVFPAGRADPVVVPVARQECQRTPFSPGLTPTILATVGLGTRSSKRLAAAHAASRPSRAALGSQRREALGVVVLVMCGVVVAAGHGMRKRSPTASPTMAGSRTAVTVAKLAAPCTAFDPRAVQLLALWEIRVDTPWCSWRSRRPSRRPTSLAREEDVVPTLPRAFRRATHGLARRRPHATRPTAPDRRDRRHPGHQAINLGA